MMPAERPEKQKKRCLKKWQESWDIQESTGGNRGKDGNTPVEQTGGLRPACGRNYEITEDTGDKKWM